LYGVLERVGDGRWNDLLHAAQTQVQTLTRRVEALEDLVETLTPKPERP
jgi:hypothetical protein